MMPLHIAAGWCTRLSGLPEVSHTAIHYAYGQGGYLVLVHLKGGSTVALSDEEIARRWIRNYHHSTEEPREER